MIPTTVSQTETNEAKDRSGEERLNLFLDRRWTFGPGSTGTGVAEGDTCAAQYKVCGSLTQLGSKGALILTFNFH